MSAFSVGVKFKILDTLSSSVNEMEDMAFVRDVDSPGITGSVNQVLQYLDSTSEMSEIPSQLIALISTFFPTFL